MSTLPPHELDMYDALNYMLLCIWWNMADISRSGLGD